MGEIPRRIVVTMDDSRQFRTQATHHISLISGSVRCRARGSWRVCRKDKALVCDRAKRHLFHQVWICDTHSQSPKSDQCVSIELDGEYINRDLWLGDHIHNMSADFLYGNANVLRQRQKLSDSQSDCLLALRLYGGHIHQVSGSVQGFLPQREYVRGHNRLQHEDGLAFGQRYNRLFHDVHHANRDVNWENVKS